MLSLRNFSTKSLARYIKMDTILLVAIYHLWSYRIATIPVFLSIQLLNQPIQRIKIFMCIQVNPLMKYNYVKSLNNKKEAQGLPNYFSLHKF